MNIFFCGSTGKTGSIVFNYLKEKGYVMEEVNLNTDPLSSIIKSNSIIIDFTNKDIAYNHALICLKNNSHFICGTTGIAKETILRLSKEAKEKELNFIFSPNFALGIKPISTFIESLKDDFNSSKIIESHHISKKDLPSGTALLLKEHLNKDTQIDSLRTTFTSLDHSIILSNEYEEITISHKVKNKLAYAIGVEKELIKIINKIKK